MRRILVLAALGALVTLVTTCNRHNPTAPSPPPVTPVTSPPHPAITNLEIVGSTALTAVGQTTQLGAKATFADGTSQDVTTSAVWSAEHPSVATVSATGLVTVVDLGEGSISAFYKLSDGAYGSRSTGVSLLILPSGTFKLSGEIREPGLIVPGARVEILDGPMAGQSRTASSAGNYVFYGVSGNLHLRASKDGYQSDTESVSMTRHQTLDFTLFPVKSPFTVMGRPAVTLTASSSCGQLPAEARTRSYTSIIDQDGAGFRVSLGGANFVRGSNYSPGNQFFGRIHDGNSVTVTINNGFYYYYPGGGILENISPSLQLTVTGIATGLATRAGMVLQLAGVLATRTPDARGKFAEAQACTASDHQLVFGPSTPMTTSKR